MKELLKALVTALKDAGYKSVEVITGKGKDQVDICLMPGNLRDRKDPTAFAAAAVLAESGLVGECQTFSAPSTGVNKKGEAEANPADRLYIRGLHDPKAAGPEKPEARNQEPGTAPKKQ